MSLSLGIDELLGYSGEERTKWQQWFTGQPSSALEASVQRGARFTTVWSLMDHIFLVEKRHTQRLKGSSQVDSETAVARPDVDALFTYARATREELGRFMHTTSDADLARPREFHFGSASLTVSPRKLVFHIFFHEIRHWAQVATAVRNAGFAPPGNHDPIFSSAFE
jgi:uncharacterized damage-inducible protein DinB